MTNEEIKNKEVTWAGMLKEAVDQPGVLSQAYRAFHNYSLGNQLLAAVQLSSRGIPFGPIAPYNGWKAKGRYVKRGEHAIALWMPITGRRTYKETDPETGEEHEVSCTRTRFVLKNNWFAFAQTDGQAIEPEPTPAWSKAKALETLKTTEELFTVLDGNCLGYCKPGRRIAVSPVCPFPVKTLIHELAHAILHDGAHTEVADMPRNLREVEAEGTAMLVCDALGIEAGSDCRGYIQNWCGHAEIPEASARRIFGAADQILKAGVL